MVDKMETMSKRIYELVKSDFKKITLTKEEIPVKLEEFDVNKEKLGKKFGLKKRDYAISCMSCTKEYREGFGQGRLDKYLGLEYQEKADDKCYNLGYYKGFNENIWGWINDAKKTNPNFTDI